MGEVIENSFDQTSVRFKCLDFIAVEVRKTK